MKSFASIISLGCVKNLVDSETLTPQLAELGYSVTPDPSRASLIVVNTCGFLTSAVEEAIESILDLAAFKSSGSCKCLIAAGCMVQRYGKKLVKLLPEVDLFLGTSHYLELGRILEAWQGGSSRKLWISAPRALVTDRTPRFRSGPLYSAYVKIAEGCSNHCSFCLIPHLRGPYRSRTVEDVVAEIGRLCLEGVREVNLVAQDTTAFGSDRGDEVGLVRLLESIECLDGPDWVRILYAYPDRISERLLSTIAQSKKVVPYLDIPLQHCAPRILNDMGRGRTGMNAESLVERVRFRVPGIALRTSLIVGFPGETEADFRALLGFVERAGLDHVGVFAFSAEPGTRASRLTGQVDAETKEGRRRELMELQREISANRLRRWIGEAVPVLVEGPHPETELLLSGRLPTQAPEVDGTVIITSGPGCPGEIVPARIIDTHDYDLEAELLTGAEWADHSTSVSNERSV